MFWLKTLNEAVGLPKLDGMAINDTFCETPRFLLIRGADINSIDDMAVRPYQIGSIFFHRRTIADPPKKNLLPDVKASRSGCLLVLSGTRHTFI
jgi:hypothetical protein